MKEIACLGKESFSLGFMLAGIKIILRANDRSSCLKAISSIRENARIGIVIIDGSLLDELSFTERTAVEDSITPLFIPLGKTRKSDDLRKLIIRSIGIDILKGE